MKYIYNHIPDNTLKDNVNVQKYLEVLQGMLEVEETEIDRYMRRYLFPLVAEIGTMRRFVDEWNAEYLATSTKYCIDCLYRNYFKIYSGKGTEQGLNQLLICLFTEIDTPTVRVTKYTQGKPLILFDDDRVYDWLPEGLDIAMEIEAQAGEEVWCPTLLDDTWEHTQSTIVISIADLGYTPSPSLLSFIQNVIILYLPMISKQQINIELNIT